jgi:hypothetical protein
MVRATQAIRVLVTRSVINTVSLVKSRGDEVHVLSVARIVAAENTIGYMVGELNES